jgi:hypothetical protein
LDYFTVNKIADACQVMLKTIIHFSDNIREPIPEIFNPGRCIDDDHLNPFALIRDRPPNGFFP